MMYNKDNTYQGGRGKSVKADLYKFIYRETCSQRLAANDLQQSSS